MDGITLRLLSLALSLAHWMTLYNLTTFFRIGNELVHGDTNQLGLGQACLISDVRQLDIATFGKSHLYGRSVWHVTTTVPE